MEKELLARDLYIGYHLIGGRPVMQKVSSWQQPIGTKVTYWIKYEKQGFVTSSEYLKRNFDCKVQNHKGD